jgi:hypothetical protein
MVAGLQRGNAGAHFLNDACALMAQDGREGSFRVGAGAGEFIGVANAGGLDLDQDFTFAGSFKVDFNHFKRLACFKCDRSPCLHECSLPILNSGSGSGC